MAAGALEAVASRLTGRTGKPVARVVPDDGQHRSPALAAGGGDDLLHAAEKAEHHGVKGLRRRIGQHIGTQWGHIADVPPRQLTAQHVQCPVVPLRRRHMPDQRRQRQREIAKTAPRVAYAVRFLQIRRQQRRQLFMKVRAFTGVRHERHTFLRPFKHRSRPPLPAAAPGRRACPAPQPPRRTAAGATPASAHRLCSRPPPPVRR